jgi:methyl-accepting chemotaxis protein
MLCEPAASTDAKMPAVRTASQSISGIVSAIDMIMFQTNPRALNAALEAVYAVESGRGFEVVASEARELTQRSAEAAREVKQLIAEVTARIGDSARLAAESGVAMKKIAAAIEEVPEAVSRIADGSGHQAARIDEVRGAMVRVEEITHRTRRWWRFGRCRGNHAPAIGVADVFGSTLRVR